MMNALIGGVRLLGETIDAIGEARGNVPRAFTHGGQVTAAAAIARARAAAKS